MCRCKALWNANDTEYDPLYNWVQCNRAEQQSDWDDDQRMKHLGGKRVIRQCFYQLTLVVEFLPEEGDQSDAHGNRYEGFPYRISRALSGQHFSRVTVFPSSAIDESRQWRIYTKCSVFIASQQWHPTQILKNRAQYQMIAGPVPLRGASDLAGMKKIHVSRCWRGAQPKLREVRAAIMEVARDAVESISYGMPFYSYKGKQGVKGRLCYFGLQKAGIGFYLRPPVIDQHMDELVKYTSTKSALRFPLDGPMSVPLIKKLVRARIKIDETGK